MTPQSKLPERSTLIEFWSVFLVPWVLDLLGGRGVFASVFGAFFWGLGLSLAVARSQTRDLKFRKWQGHALLLVSMVWLVYWGSSFIEVGGRAYQTETGNLRWLILTHAGLLAAGVGMVLLLWASSVLWLAQESLLRQGSFERRGRRWELPSLEALAKVTRGAANLAFLSWGLGFFLALLNAILSGRSAEAAPHVRLMAWLSDPKVIGTAVLWVVLALTFQLKHLLSSANRWLFRSYFALSIFFLVAFVYWFMVRVSGPALHEPLDWFIR